MATIHESLGQEKILIQAGAATVGRPKGLGGKKMAPRRATFTKKEVDHVTTKGLKAGGPSSGRHAAAVETAKKHGYNAIRTTRQGTVLKHPLGHILHLRNGNDIPWVHKPDGAEKPTYGRGVKNLHNELKNNGGY